mgnify:CR=1 FL=1
MEKLRDFFKRDWTMSEKVLLAADLVLAGVLIGWLTSPLKGGMFSNNTINSNNEELAEIELEEEEEE